MQFCVLYGVAKLAEKWTKQPSFQLFHWAPRPNSWWDDMLARCEYDTCVHSCSPCRHIANNIILKPEPSNDTISYMGWLQVNLSASARWNPPSQVWMNANNWGSSHSWPLFTVLKIVIIIGTSLAMRQHKLEMYIFSEACQWTYPPTHSQTLESAREARFGRW